MILKITERIGYQEGQSELPQAMRVCSLFSGIAGLELGLSRVGFEAIAFCENDPAAQAVLEEHFGGIRLFADITSMKALPPCDLVTAGWPCQDLSQAGKLAGRHGDRSGLIEHVFRLIEGSASKPKYILLENVAFALRLQGGSAIKHVTGELERLGYNWAYRIIDAREFGVPQRRRRIYVAAARQGSPVSLLYDGSRDETTAPLDPRFFGFYWTEGNRGIGWTPEAIPPLKGGSGFSIPSPPSVWDSATGAFFVPGIRDAEAIQGFPLNWTKPAEAGAGGARARWRLVGNSVSPPVAQWIGERIAAFDVGSLAGLEPPSSTSRAAHNLAWGRPGDGSEYRVVTTEGPQAVSRKDLRDFDLSDIVPLSNRAASGFLDRVLRSSLRVDGQFIRHLTAYSLNGLTA